MPILRELANILLLADVAAAWSITNYYNVGPVFSFPSVLSWLLNVAVLSLLIVQIHTFSGGSQSTILCGPKCPHG